MLEESGILDFGIHDSTQGIRNPANVWNPESPAGNPVSKTVLDLPCMGRHVYFSSNISSDWFCHTSETAVVILLPPEAPIISGTSPVSFVKMAGDMDENGRLPGWGKLTSDG